MAIILHLMPAAEWELSAGSENVTNASLADEGFIHCTDAPSMMLQVANAFYRDRAGDFVVLHIEADALTSRCVWEAPVHVVPRPTTGSANDAPDGPLAAGEKSDVTFAPAFPHVYGPIDRDAIRAVQPMTRDGSGVFTDYGELGPTV